MKFDAAYGYYAITPKVLGNGYCLFKSPTHEDYAMEIGTGALILTQGMRLIHENSEEEISSIEATVIVDGMDICTGQSVLMKVKAHRLAFLNPDSIVEIVYPNYTTRVMFPFHDDFKFMFINGGGNLGDVPRRELSVPLSIQLTNREHNEKFTRKHRSSKPTSR